MAGCRCLTSRDLLKHHQKCQSNNCPICTPVKQYVQKQRREMQTHQQVEAPPATTCMLHRVCAASGGEGCPWVEGGCVSWYGSASAYISPMKICLSDELLI